MDYEEIKSRYNKNDMIKSLRDGVVKKYSGFLTLCGDGYDSTDIDLVVYKDGEFAEVIEKGVDHEDIAFKRHIDSVMSQCRRIGCSPFELLKSGKYNK